MADPEGLEPSTSTSVVTRSIKSLITAGIITQLHHQERDNFCSCNSEQDTNIEGLDGYLRVSAGTRKFPKEIRNNGHTKILPAFLIFL